MNYYFHLVTLFFMILLCSTNALAIDMSGTWTMEGTWTAPSGQSGSDTCNLDIERYMSGSNDFVGKFNCHGTYYGPVKGRIIAPTSPSTHEVIIIERIDLYQTYQEVMIAHSADANHIINGRFVDTHGNVGSFSMHK